MTATRWEDIAGEVCLDCGRPASHYYGGPICCQCHIKDLGDDGSGFTGLCDPQETIAAHLKVALNGMMELDGIDSESPQYKLAEKVLKITKPQF